MKSQKKMKRLCAVLLTLVLGAGGAALAQCPAQGSGAAGVAAWAAANCGAEDCDNPTTTCNDEFTIEYLGMDEDGDLVTFMYEICQISDEINPSAPALGHWVMALGQITCLADGMTLDDLVVGATLDGEPLDEEDVVIGLDPTTQVSGVKFDHPAPDKGCHTWTIIFDTSALADGWTLGEGCVLAATKAGNQDIRNSTRPSPGYACIVGPVCVEEACDWIDETAWAAGTRYNEEQGNWATYTPYVADSTVILYAGQTMPAGTVHFSTAAGGNVTITITLNAGWRFKDAAENVKIQDYATAPSGNPSPGGFAHKYNATDSPFISIPAVPANYYGVHVDVEHEVCE